MTAQLLDVKSVAESLCISEAMVYKLVRTGRLPRIRIGRRTLFHPDDIAAYVESCRESAVG